MADNSKEDLAEYRAQHGRFREGAGRPSLGVTKKVSITLLEEVWARVEQVIQETNEKTQSAYLRHLIMKHLEEVAKGISKLRAVRIVKRKMHHKRKPVFFAERP